MKIKIEDGEFEVEYELEDGIAIESLAVFLPNDSDSQDLVDVLEEKVLKQIEEEIYKHLPDGPEDDPREDR